MSISISLLLRLPPALRSHALPLLHQHQPIFQCLPRRPFSIFRHLQLKTPIPKPHRITKASSPAQSVPSPATPTPKKPVGVRYRPPQPTTFTHALTPILKKINPLLLYNAPSHKSFYITAYVFGLSMLVGAVLQAQLIKDEPGRKLTLSARIPSLLVGIFFAAMGWRMIIAPMKLVRRIALVAHEHPAPHPITVRFQMRRVQPFKPGVVIDVPLKEATLDTNVPLVASYDPSDPSAKVPLQWYSVPFADAANFTEARLFPPTPEKLTIVQRFRRGNTAMVDSGAGFRQNVKRIFFREGMAYVRIPGHGNWKIDLQGCEMLEDGRPLEQVTTMDVEMDRSVWKTLKAWTGQ